MRLIAFLFRLPVILLLYLCSAVSLAQDDPLAIVRQASDAIIERLTIEQERVQNEPDYVVSLIEELLLPHIADRTIARRVLAESWQTATEAQRDRFVNEFRTYMVRFYAQVFMIYSGEQVEYSAADDTSHPLRRKIISHITPKNGQTVQAAYRMENKKGIWKVTDIAVDGVSLVHSNRQQYKHLIARDGLDKVIDMLANHNKKPLR